MFLLLQWLWVYCMRWLRAFFVFLFPEKLNRKFGRLKLKEDKKIFCRHPPKPAWVRDKIIRFKAFMPEAGCRKIAHTFNRIFAHDRQMTVSKTFVNEVIRKYHYEIQIVRRKIKNRIPRDVAKNLIWGMDLTGKMDDNGDIHNIIGIIEYKSRACLNLIALKDKASITILRCLLDAIEHYSKPKFLRTDNESVFTSRLFRFGLWLIGIRHQTIDKGCPWQNGRMERFFGTLKEKLKQIEIYSKEGLNDALKEFRFWYNHVRTHQNLGARIPAEVWVGKDIFKQESKQNPKRKYWFEAWEGLLTGIYLKL